jgi:hypothetical protein
MDFIESKNVELHNSNAKNIFSVYRPEFFQILKFIQIKIQTSCND